MLKVPITLESEYYPDAYIKLSRVPCIGEKILLQSTKLGVQTDPKLICFKVTDVAFAPDTNEAFVYIVEQHQFSAN